MAARERYSVEQIIAKLVEAEKLQGQGLTIPQACKRLQISDQTFYRRPHRGLGMCTPLQYAKDCREGPK